MVRIAPTFGGIHLEDISAPECLEIERRLIDLLPQPVMHGDVHGTAVVSVAAAIVACRHAGIELGSAEKVMGEADVVVATTGRPGLIEPSMVRGGQVILALSNPDPEIYPQEAERAGAAFAGDGPASTTSWGTRGSSAEHSRPEPRKSTWR